MTRTFNTICHNNKYKTTVKTTVLIMTGMNGFRGSISMPLNGRFKVMVNETSMGLIYTSIFIKDGRDYMYSCEEARFTDYFYTSEQLMDLRINTILGV